MVGNIINVEGGFTKVVNVESKIKDNDMVEITIYVRVYYSNEESRRDLLRKISRLGFFQEPYKPNHKEDTFKKNFFININ